MTDPAPATVAVPVELLSDWAERMNGYDFGMAEEIRSVVPKPTPRLVAVDIDYIDGMASVELASYLFEQPDLLTREQKTMLEEAMRPVMMDDRLGIVMARIRAALGVTE